MSIEKAEAALCKRFAEPLPDFYRRRIIFWKDEDREFTEHIHGLQIPDVKLVTLTETNSFSVKMLLETDTESNYLVYMPFSYEKPEDNWLSDILRYSETFRADLISMRMSELHMKESIPLRRAMKLYRKFFDSKERISGLKAFGSEYHSAGQLHLDVMAVLCGTDENTPSGILKAVLTEQLCHETDECMKNMQKFGSEAAFWELLAQKYGYTRSEEGSFQHIAACFLISALSVNIDSALLSPLEEYMTDFSQYRQARYDFISAWLASDDESLYHIARQTETFCQLPEILDRLEIQQILGCDCLPCIDECIIRHYMKEISENIVKPQDIVNTVEKRRTLKWYDKFSDYYDGLFQIAEMQKFIYRNAAGYHFASGRDMFRAYCDEYYLMDTCYRRFHEALGRCQQKSDSELEDLFKTSVDYAENLYQNEYLAKIGTVWAELIKEDMALDGEISRIPKQSSFYLHKVYPLIENSRVFVIISDALRYEVAAELNEVLIRETKGTATLSAMQSVFPSVTKSGMAALLPNRKLRMTEQLKFLCDDMPTEGTENREKILKSQYSGNTAITYQELLSMKKTERRERIRNAKVIYLYHNTIDVAGEKANTEYQVFTACREAIAEIRNIVRIIVNDMNGTNIFITADHGFLYTQLSERDKLEKELVNGTILETDRRYLIADSESRSEYLMKVSMKKYNSDCIGYAVPDYSRIRKQGGGANYVHGGISLQELTIPLIEFKNLRAGAKGFVNTRRVEMELLTSTRRVSNTLFQLSFYQKEPVGGKVLPNAFEVYFSDESGEHVSDVQLIIADKTSEDVRERTYRRQFAMKSRIYAKEETYFLNIIEKSTGICIFRAEFAVNIAFTDDFDF